MPKPLKLYSCSYFKTPTSDPLQMWDPIADVAFVSTKPCSPIPCCCPARRRRLHHSHSPQCVHHYKTETYIVSVSQRSASATVTLPAAESDSFTLWGEEGIVLFSVFIVCLIALCLFWNISTYPFVTFHVLLILNKVIIRCRTRGMLEEANHLVRRLFNTLTQLICDCTI